MLRKSFDAIISTAGIMLTFVLLVAGALGLWAATYTHNSVSQQLTAQEIYFPPADSPAIAKPEFAPMKQYAGQQLTTGPQAKIYADYFIANHLKEIGGGKTYSEVSAASLADPTNTALHNQALTMFQGNTLRGLLLTSSAFWQLGTIAFWAAIACFALAVITAALTVFGWLHFRRVPANEMLLPHEAPRGFAAAGS